MLYLPSTHALHSLIPALEPYLPAGQAMHVELPAEYVPAGHEAEPVAPARDSCVTGPVAVQAVEASMEPLYTEW